MNSLNRNRYLFIPGLLPLVIIGIFYFLIVKYSIDIPWFDDIENIPYFLIRWLNAPTLVEKWQTIIFPNNEHRVLTARIIVLAQYILTGHLNFKVLLFIGNLSVLALFGFIAYGHIRYGGKWYMIAPVVFFIFNFQSYSGTFMTIMSMQYQMVILLSVASFFFLVKESHYSFIVAILLAWIDTFSMGNGMMVWPSGLVILLFQVRWKESAVWLIAGVIAIYFYFHGYDFVQGNDKGFSYILVHPVRTVVVFFTMLGGDFDVIANAVFPRRMLLPTLAGLVLFTIFCMYLLAIWSTSAFWGARLSQKMVNYFQQFPQVRDSRWNAFWLGTMVYVLISMTLVVVFRTRFDPDIILWSTYKMYPAVLTSVIYILVIRFFSGKSQVMLFLLFFVLSAGVWASTLVNYLPIIKNTSEMRTAFAFNQKRNGVGLGATKNSAFEAMVVKTLKSVDSLGIYSLPVPLIHADGLKINLNDSTVTDYTRVELKEAENNLNIRPISPSPKIGHKYAILQSKDNLYLFTMPSDEAGADCPKGTIREGEYKIGIWIVNQNRTTVLSCNEKVNIL